MASLSKSSTLSPIFLKNVFLLGDEIVLEFRYSESVLEIVVIPMPNLFERITRAWLIDKLGRVSNFNL